MQQEREPRRIGNVDLRYVITDRPPPVREHPAMDAPPAPTLVGSVVPRSRPPVPARRRIWDHPGLWVLAAFFAGAVLSAAFIRL